MGIRNIIAADILAHWGYYNVTVGDLDHRNFKAKYSVRKQDPARDKSYKTSQAVAHAYRLADIAIERLTRGFTSGS